MAFEPTKQQEKAIKRNGNILVSAAAGSGKTAVLVERVIRLLTDENNPVNADELLIVTFTNAAAAEMRSRIEKRIDEECRNNPDSVSLLTQKHLLNNAKICTIDSFCIDLVRDNFDKLDISPDFKIGENAALKEIDESIVYKIIARYIKEENQDFLNLVDLINGEYDEKKLAELLLEAYEYSRQFPYPEKWYDSLIAKYDNGVFSKENIWYNYAFAKAIRTIENMQVITSNCINAIANVELVADKFLIPVQDFAVSLSKLYDVAILHDWDKFYNALNEFEIPKFPDSRGKVGKYRECKAFKASVDDFENYIEKLKRLFYNDLSFVDSQFKKIYPLVCLFVDILKELDTEIFNEYNRQNTFTFHNIEHLALKLLCNEEDGKTVITENGKELLDQYAEVMVDEYQDTNDLQDRLFFVLSNYEKKLFVVGDVKQSIYAFRGANPINFLNKKDRYIDCDNCDETAAQKIILANNFRTKTEVCEFINYFFELFMTKRTGEIDYSGEERLIPTAEFPETNDPSVTFDLIDCKDMDEKTWVYEGRAIAQYINKVMSDGDVIKDVDKKTKLPFLRKAEYGDFTILMRAMTNTPHIIKELKLAGIPVDICLDSYAENREILIMLALLKIIDNPNSDIELLTLLMSPIFGFTPDDMAEIRAEKKYSTLYSSVLAASNNGNKKATDFIIKIEKYRLLSVSLKLPDLITKLLIETEFLNIITAFPDGDKRKNNLLILVELAQQFNLNGGNNISAFISFVKNYSSSKSKSSSGNAVKIMTIHGSKGLQFPVCIVAGTNSPFNNEESKQSACYNINYGIGFKYYDEELKQPFSTVSRESILDNIKSISLQDELRLLYVALTRTQDKLLIVSAHKKLDDSINKYKNRLVMHNFEISKEYFNETRSFADWLVPSLLLHPDGSNLRDSGDMIIPISDKSHVEINVIDGSTLEPVSSILSDPLVVGNAELSAKIKENTDFIYPYNDILNIRSKTSVSALANKAESDKFAFSQRPSFMSKGNMTATDRGTAMHHVMQYFDFTKCDDIDTEIERLYEWQFISENEYNSLDREALKKFFESDIFNRIKNAKMVEREMRFLTEVPATMIDTTLDNTFNNEMVIIQGAVDACFIEDDGIVILDFKTDRVGEASALAEAYGMQLSIYALAAEKIFKLPVKEKIIYSFALGKEIII